jgi:hypothetical protein
MAKVQQRDIKRDVPEEVFNRFNGNPVDEWLKDSSETKEDATKFGALFIVGSWYFYFGFVRPYKYKYGKSGKELPQAGRWRFYALHFISKEPGQEGNWYKVGYDDADFDNILSYLIFNISSDETTQAVVDKLKLFPTQGNEDILTLCRDFIVEHIKLNLGLMVGLTQKEKDKIEARANFLSGMM